MPKLRHVLLANRNALGWETPHQAIAAAKMLGHGDHNEQPDAFKAPGRGPGGGPDATPYNITALLLAALVGGPQTQSAGAVQTLYSAPHGATAADESSDIVPEGADDLADLHVPLPCPVTREGVCGDAVRACLADPVLAARVDRIEVRRGAVDGTIFWRDGRASRFVRFNDRRERRERDARGELRTVAIVGGALLVKLAREIAS